MKHNHRYNKNRVKNIKSARTMILFIIITAFVIGCNALMAVKFSESKQAVQAIDVNKEASPESNGEDNTNKNLIKREVEEENDGTML